MKHPLRALREAALWVVAALGAVCLAFAVASVAFGVTPLIFSSGSMSPGIPTGSLAIAVSTPASELVPGDIVSVTWSDGHRVTHRVVSLTARGGGSVELTTRGDANNIDDAEHQVVTKADRVIWSTPGLGFVVDEATKPQWMFTLGVVVGGLVTLAFLGARTRVEPRRARRERAARHAGPRDSRAGAAVGVGASVVVLALLASLVAHAPTDTEAAYVNQGAARGTFATTTIVAPTITGCTVSSFLGVFQSVTVTWTMPAGYSVSNAVVGTGSSAAAISPTSPAPTISGTGPYSTTYSSGFLTTILGSLFGSTTWIGVRSTVGTWTSAWSTRKLSIGLLGLGSTCTVS